MDWSKFNTQLRSAVDTGKVIYGTRETIKDCLGGEPKLIIVSSTIRNTIKKQIEHYSKLLKVNVIEYPENGFELGSVCGKPFSVSALIVNEFGQSTIIKVIESKDVVVAKENAKIKVKAEKKAKKEDKKAEKVKAKKLKELKQKEEEEIPLIEDEALKGILKIKKR